MRRDSTIAVFMLLGFVAALFLMGCGDINRSQEAGKVISKEYREADSTYVPEERDKYDDECWTEEDFPYYDYDYYDSTWNEYCIQGETSFTEGYWVNTPAKYILVVESTSEDGKRYLYEASVPETIWKDCRINQTYDPKHMDCFLS